MIRVDKQGFVKSDPEDVILNPEKFVIITDGKIYVHPKWASVKYLPKKFVLLVNQLLAKYYSSPNDKFDWKVVLFLLLATSRCYSALSRAFSNKKKNFKSVFYLEDLFHTVIEVYLDLLQNGFSKEEIFKYENNSCLLESRVLKKHLDFLYSYALERPFGEAAVLDAYIYGQVEDEDAG